jgi:hypothetical protein
MESYPRKLALPGMVAERFTCGPPPSSSGPQKLDQGPRNPGPGSSPLEHIFAPIWAVPLFGRARLYPTDSERSDRQTELTLGANAAARPRHRCLREGFKPPSCAVPSGAPRTNELFTPRSACARRSDRPELLRCVGPKRATSADSGAARNLCRFGCRAKPMIGNRAVPRRDI